MVLTYEQWQAVATAKKVPGECKISLVCSIMVQKTGKRWSGRFSAATDEFVEQFTESVSFDRRLYHFDILASVAHANGLAKAGVIAEDERDAIVGGLDQIREEIEAGSFSWLIVHEDVHTNIENRLVEIVGEVGKKLHAGRSRNDQVATDLRLWLRHHIDQIDAQMTTLLSDLAGLAERHADAIMPGLTHMQNAQPVTFGHHMMAWFEMLHRDRARLRECRDRVNHSPLGAAALAGTSFPISRENTASELGFEEVCRNSLDAVSDRDFAIEFAFVASVAAVHQSRWCEELVYWSSDLIGFVKLPDEYCTGSSIMPQKKNPDVPEIIRGKSGRVLGDLVALLTLVKSQPLAYNRDNQEDKQRLFDAVDTLSDCLRILSDLIPKLEPNVERMFNAASKGYTTATDMADWLVRRGVAFREAHEIVGRVVAEAENRGMQLHELSLPELQEFSERFDEEVFSVLSIEGSVAARRQTGGTSPEAVRAAIAEARTRI